VLDSFKVSAMIQTAPVQQQGTGVTSIPGLRPIRLWGLSPAQVHDAYWHSRGVQCVRRGMRVVLQKGAEQFLLVEPRQLVLFELSELAERLRWHDAAVTRLRLTDELDQQYSERVVTNAQGRVERIERRYRPEVRGSSRVMLTDSRKVASMWMNARNRHDGWDKARRSVPWSRVDHWKCRGVTFVDGDPLQERELMDELVERWRFPKQSIAGVEEMEEGVWHVQGESLPAEAMRIGPLWLGRGSSAAYAGKRCIVGPAWVPDSDVARKSSLIKIGLRDIEEIELPDLPEEMEPVEPPRRLYLAMKRMFDILGSGLALIAFMPVMLVVATCIAIEDGWPIFFGHRRQGRHGGLFKCWKFRTMVPHAEKLARQLEDNKCDGPQINIANDPRVTRVGRRLRAWHLDELPQFWNVLIGQMSLVGPRPSPDDENQFCPAWRDSRLSVRPGITGLWQLLRTRQEGEDFQEWIKYDIEYVQRASLRLDVEILLRTALIMVIGRRGRGT